MADTRITDLTAAGSLTGSELLEISQLSTSVTISAGTISALASDNSYNDSANGFLAAGFGAGDRVYVAGFTGNTANNIFVGTITAITAGKMTIGGTDGDVIVDDAAGETVTITKWLSRRTTAGEVARSGLRGALVKKSADQNAANYTTSSAVTFESEVRDTDGIHNFSSTVTITIATPGVVTWNTHGLSAGATIVLTTTGALPTGLTAGTIYYIVNPTTNTFQLASTSGGAAINTTGSQSGTHTATNTSTLRVPPGVSCVQVACSFRIQNLTAGNSFQAVIQKNGSQSWDGVAQQLSGNPNGANDTIYCASAAVPVSPGDNFDATLFVNSDASVDVIAARSWFEMRIIS